LYTERKTNEFFSKLHPEHLRDDLRQFTFSALLEMANDNPSRLIAINEKPGALFGFMTKIAKRQLTGSNSKFRKVFRAENIVDIDDRQDIDLLHQNDEFESDRDLREEILSLWATGGAVYSNDLASVQRIYAAGRALKSELKYIEEIQRGLFGDGYVLYNVPVLVRFENKEPDTKGIQHRINGLCDRIALLRKKGEFEKVKFIEDELNEAIQLKKETDLSKGNYNVADAAEFLSNVMQKLVGRELGRENNAFVVRTGAAVVVETKL
jgi:hypothetical protein